MGFTIVYLVAGMSSRYKGKIKAFAEVGPNNETLIEISLNQALKAGANKIIFIVSKQTEQPFKEKLGNNYKDIPIEYAIQEFNSEKRDKPWGTCDAVCSIKEINNPFIVATGDDLYGKKTFEILAQHLENNQEDATAVVKLIDLLPKQGFVNRGIFKVDEENYITDAQEIIGVEKNNLLEKGVTENTPSSISIFALHPETLQFLKEKLNLFKRQHSNDRRIECFLNTTLGDLIKENKIKMKILYTPEKWMGITNPGDEILIRKELKKTIL